MEANIRLAKREARRMNKNWKKRREKGRKRRYVDWVGHLFIANLKKKKKVED